LPKPEIHRNIILKFWYLLCRKETDTKLQSSKDEYRLLFISGGNMKHVKTIRW